MFAIVWRYDVAPDAAVEFESAYGPDGAWALLFRLADGFAGTDLVRCDEPGRYLTIDRWRDRQAFDEFIRHHRDAYDRLDAELEPLTLAEELVGRGDTVQPT